MSTRASNVQLRAKREIKTKPPRPRRQRQRRRRRNAGLPAAVLNSNSTSAMILNRRNGAQMVVKEVFPVYYHPSETLDFALPFSPTKWAGTRTATLLSTFSSYRPRRCIIRWQTAVGTTTNGNIAIGTTFQGSSFNLTTRPTAYQALPASNGGISTSIYRNTWKGVTLSSSLGANLYANFNVDPDDVPFWILAVAETGLDANTKLGDLVVEAVLSVHNPCTVSEVNPSALNISTSITHDNENNVTTLSVLKDLIAQPLSAGKDYYFTFNRPLFNTSSAMLAKPLKFISANLSQITDSNYIFSLDSMTQSVASLIGSLIGPSSQQFFQ